jgi:hypothetical protein
VKGHRKAVVWGSAVFLAAGAAAGAAWFFSRPALSAFADDSSGRTLAGYRNRWGRCVIPPQFILVPAEWRGEWQWVWDADCDDTEACAASNGYDFSGNFIDKTGRKLLPFHAHAVTRDLIFDTYPAFDHGLAFVRCSDGHIYGVTEDGNRLPLHETWGPFRELDGFGGQEYIGYDGRCAFVRFLDGRYAILDENHELSAPPTDDFDTLHSTYLSRMASLGK